MDTKTYDALDKVGLCLKTLTIATTIIQERLDAIERRVGLGKHKVTHGERVEARQKESSVNR